MSSFNYMQLEHTFPVVTLFTESVPGNNILFIDVYKDLGETELPGLIKGWQRRLGQEFKKRPDSIVIRMFTHRVNRSHGRNWYQGIQKG